VFQRIIGGTPSGDPLWHVYVTLRLAATGSAIGCAFAVVLPFLLRRMPLPRRRRASKRREV